MKASDLINQLTELVAEHGDLPVRLEDPNTVYPVRGPVAELDVIQAGDKTVRGLFTGYFRWPTCIRLKEGL